MNHRTTQRNITSLAPNEIFVFGSNLSGIHGAGAAKTARKWGAILGQAKGLQGNTYAIPTKDKAIRNTSPLHEIGIYVDEFIIFASDSPTITFLVTEIGCGLAGLTPEQVAPLFRGAIPIENIHLPESFWEVLNRD